MPTLATLPTRKPELELAFVAHRPALTQAMELTGVVTVTPEQLLEHGAPAQLPDGAAVLITDIVPFRLRGRIATVLDSLLQRMSRDGSAGLIASAAPGARQPFPQATLEAARHLDIALLVTTAPPERWEGVHDAIQQHRLMFAERRAAQLGSLVQELPAQLADPRAMQRIADWLASAAPRKFVEGCSGVEVEVAGAVEGFFG
ncbi:hypothetical protein [Streptomyces sp. A5-4]|uniref:hypothetical protein n=1 Tax=Streptomyces sp. A5-4 TaxID=3384771 RepID=UPI003DA9F45E